MIRASLADFTQNIEKYFDMITGNSVHLIVRTGNGKGVVVMLLDEFCSMNATDHELSSKINETRLDAAIERLKAGNSFSNDLIEP